MEFGIFGFVFPSMNFYIFIIVNELQSAHIVVGIFMVPSVWHWTCKSKI